MRLGGEERKGLSAFFFYGDDHCTFSKPLTLSFEATFVCPIQVYLYHG